MSVLQIIAVTKFCLVLDLRKKHNQAHYTKENKYYFIIIINVRLIVFYAGTQYCFLCVNTILWSCSATLWSFSALVLCEREFSSSVVLFCVWRRTYRFLLSSERYVCLSVTVTRKCKPISSYINLLYPVKIICIITYLVICLVRSSGFRSVRIKLES